LLRVQDKVCKMRDPPKSDRTNGRSTRTLAPVLQDPEKAVEFLKENKERAEPVKA
jgi:hypothetical protein